MSNTIASLPMYDCFLPYEDSDVIWKSMRKVDEEKAKKKTSILPVALDLFSSCHSVWTAGAELCFSQTCGYPLVKEYSKFLQIIGTPIYAAPGCDGAYYSAAVVVSTARCRQLNDKAALSLEEYLTLSGKNSYSNGFIRLAVNGFNSFSGWVMLLSSIAESISEVKDRRHAKEKLASDTLTTDRKIIKSILLTGSHIGSMLAVRNGEADIATIDCVSLALARMHCPALVEGLTVLRFSRKAPALPYVTEKAASLEKVSHIQRCLQAMTVDCDSEVIAARQQHLLIGVDISGAITLETYAHAIHEHSMIIESNAELSQLFKILQPGKPPRNPFTVNVGSSSTLVTTVSDVEDRNWVAADFDCLQYLRRFLLEMIYNEIFKACKIRAAEKQDHLNVFSYLSISVLLQSLDALVGKQLWPILPNGGKPKVIFCSITGVLSLIRAVVYEEQDDSLQQPCGLCDELQAAWMVISDVAEAALLYLADAHGVIDSVNENASARINFIERIDYETDGIYRERERVEKQQKRMQRNDNTPYFAGFMGGAAPSLFEYFDDAEDIDPSSERKEKGQGSPTKKSNDLISALWAADISLSNHLLRIGPSLGIIAYISAPRHNNRHDWANLVIGSDEDSILKWRDGACHYAVRKYVAPYSYEHIRLHRGVLTNGLGGSTMELKRTAFLKPHEYAIDDADKHTLSTEERPVHPDFNATCGHIGGAPTIFKLNDDEKRILHVRVQKSETSDECTATDEKTIIKGFQRYVVEWKKISASPPAAAAPAGSKCPFHHLHAAEQLAETAVPGGGGRKVIDFKNDIVSGTVCPYVTI